MTSHLFSSENSPIFTVCINCTAFISGYEQMTWLFQSGVDMAFDALLDLEHNSDVSAFLQVGFGDLDASSFLQVGFGNSYVSAFVK